MYLDFKVTVWERVFIPEEMRGEILKGLEDGSIQNQGDLPFDLDFESETMYDTGDQMSLEENEGQATIIFVERDFKTTLFENGL